MSPRSNKLLVMAVGVLVICLAAVFIADRRAPQSAAEVAGPAVPGLLDRVAKLDEVVISGSSGPIATLRRGEDRWMLGERAYPADEVALRKLLLTLARSKQVERKTANPELYDRLGVEPLDAPEARGALVELRGGGEPIRLIVGDNPSRGEGTYVRGADEAQSWLIDSNIAVERQTANWLDRALTDIEVARIASVRVETGKDVVEIKARDDAAGDFEIANLPKGREPASEYIADSVAGWLQDLRMEDVAADDAGQAGTWKLHFETVDGLAVDAEVWKQDAESWARFSVSLDEAVMAAAIAAEQAKAAEAWEAQQATARAGEETGDAVNADEGAATTTASAEAVTAEASTTSTQLADAAPAENPDAKGAEGSGETEPSGDAPLAVRDPKAHRAEREQALRDEFSALSERFAERRFRIPAHKAANAERQFEDYLKPKG